MNRILAFALQDFRQIFRDKTLLLFLFLPILILLVLKFGVPAIINRFPIVLEYKHYINMFGGMQVAIMFGIISSFILLDEKDDGLIPVLRILPITSGQFIFNRLCIITLLTAIGSYVLMQYSGLGTIAWWKAGLLALQYALWVPIISLTLGIFAANKVQGMAYFKGINLLMILPVITFFLPDIFKTIGALIPLFWTFDSYIRIMNNEPFYLSMFVGFIFHFALVFLLGKLFKKKLWSG